MKDEFPVALITLDENKDTSGIKPCQDDTALSCTVAVVNVDAFTADVLSVPECNNMREKNIIQNSDSRVQSGEEAHSVAYENTDGCEAVFTYRNGKVMGNVDLPNGRDFVLEPCAAFSGCHVWKEEDTTKFFDGEGEVVPISERYKRSSSRAREQLREQGIRDNTTIVTFSIKFYYTREFAASTDDIQLYMEQVTAETNQGYINSLIPVRMKIHCIEAAALNDIADGGEMLSTFRTYKGSVEALHGGADASALIVNSFNYCGIGYLNSWTNGWTVTAQQKACALGYYTMGHELGHNFGAHHDRQTTSGGAYPYGYGAFIGSGPYRTNMAYRTNTYNKKANIYSSPVAKFQGVVTGSATEDNARVIKENRFAMAAVGDETGTCDWQSSSTTPSTGPTTQPPSSCSVDNAYQIFSTGYIGRLSAADCKTRCTSDSTCVSWDQTTRRYWGWYTMNRCWHIKSSQTTRSNYANGPDLTKEACNLSKAPCSQSNRLSSIRYIGNTPASTGDACQTACKNNSACTQWNLASTTCYMYSAFYRNYSGFTAGPKHC